MTTDLRALDEVALDRNDAGARSAHEDRGAALILAIAFVVMIGSIGAGMASLISSSLNNRISLEQVRNRQFAADGAIEDAIAGVRLAATTPGTEACQSLTGVSRTNSINSLDIRVDWKSACALARGADSTVILQRNVLFSACEDTGAACTKDSVIISAQVNFEQTGSAPVSKTFVQSWSVNQ